MPTCQRLQNGAPAVFEAIADTKEAFYQVVVVVVVVAVVVVVLVPLVVLVLVVVVVVLVVVALPLAVCGHNEGVLLRLATLRIRGYVQTSSRRFARRHREAAG